MDFIKLLLFSFSIWISHNSHSQRDAYHEFSMEIDHQSNQTESFNAIFIDTFGYEIENFYRADGTYYLSEWKRYPYHEFKMYSDGEYTHKLYISEKDSLRLSYSEDSVFIKYSGYSVRNRVKYFTSVLENGTITRKVHKPYNRNSSRCLRLNVLNTNFLLKDKLNSLSIEYNGVPSKELELKSDELDLSRTSWSIYNVTPNELDTVEVFITHKNGDTLYSEFFIVVDRHDESFEDFKAPSQNCCDKIFTYDNIKIVRSKNQRIVVRSKNYDPTKFHFEIENGKLIENENNVLQIEWGKDKIGSVTVRYESEIIHQLSVWIQD
jgi:hypothetical protein